MYNTQAVMSDYIYENTSVDSHSTKRIINPLNLDLRIYSDTIKHYFLLILNGLYDGKSYMQSCLDIGVKSNHMMCERIKRKLLVEQMIEVIPEDIKSRGKYRITDKGKTYLLEQSVNMVNFGQSILNKVSTNQPFKQSPVKPYSTEPLIGIVNDK